MSDMGWGSKGGVSGAKQSRRLCNHLYQCSISVYTPAKSRENKESKIQVNKLIGDLHKQLLQQGKKQCHIGFSIPSLWTPWSKHTLEMSVLYARI